MTVDFDQIAALAPLLLISGAGCLALLLDTMTKGREPALRLAQLGCLAALAAVAGQWTGAESANRSGPACWLWIECRSFSTPC